MSDIKHGTPQGYKQGCRLECCRAAKRAERALAIARRSGETTAPAAAPAKPAKRSAGVTVAQAVATECAPYLTASPALCAMAAALAAEIDSAAGVSVAAAAKQLAATLEAIKAETKGASKSDDITSKWGRPAIVPAAVRNTA